MTDTPDLTSLLMRGPGWGSRQATCSAVGVNFWGMASDVLMGDLQLLEKWQVNEGFHGLRYLCLEESWEDCGKVGNGLMWKW